MVSSWYDFAMCSSGQNRAFLQKMAPGVKSRIVRVGNHIRKNNSITHEKIDEIYGGFIS